MRVYAWTSLTAGALGGALKSTDPAATLAWTAAAFVCAARAVQSSDRLSRWFKVGVEHAEWRQTSPRARWAIVAMFGALPLVSWGLLFHVHFAPAWQPPRREALRQTTGELAWREHTYSLNPAGQREILILCEHVGKGNSHHCLPDDLARYVGRQVTISYTQLVNKGRMRASIYAMTAGDRVLVSYDDVVAAVRRHKQQDIAGATRFSPFLTLLMLLPFYLKVGPRPRSEAQRDGNAQPREA